MSLISQIEKLSEVKIKRQSLLLDIRSQISDYNFDFDFNSFTEKISDRENTPYKTRGYLIQLMSKIIQFQPNFKDRGLILVKRVLEDEDKRLNDASIDIKEEGVIDNNKKLSDNLIVEENFNQERFFILKSILFFYFIVDYRILLSFNISEDEDELLHIRNRFLFVDYGKIDRKFEIPENDLIGYNNRIINFDRIQNNVMDSLKLSKFKFLSDFILFTAEFPFLNRLSFIKKWAGFDDKRNNNSAEPVNDEVFYKTIIDSQLFIYNNDLIIYDPQERVKADKFVNSREERLKIASEINRRLDFNKKSKLLSGFISNYIKTSDYIDTNRGLCLIGFDGKIIINKYINTIVKITDKNQLADLVDDLISNFYNRNIHSADNDNFILISGICFRVEISDLIVGENDNIGKLIILNNAIDKLLLLNTIYHHENSYILNMGKNEKFKYLDSIYTNLLTDSRSFELQEEINLYDLFRKVIVFYKIDLVRYKTEISIDSSSFNTGSNDTKFKDISIMCNEKESNLFESLKLLTHLILNYYEDNKSNQLQLVFNNDNKSLIKIAIVSNIKLFKNSFINGSVLSLVDNEFKNDSLLNIVYLNNYFSKVFNSKFIIKEEFDINNKFTGTSFQFEIKV